MNKKIEACKEKVYVITKKDLPLSCPTDDMTLWNAHPKVYLAIEEAGGKIICPYCDAKYVLKEND